MSNYTCEECCDHDLVGDNDEYEKLTDLITWEEALRDYSVTNKNCPVPERY